MAINFNQLFKLIFPHLAKEPNSIFTDKQKEIIERLIKYQDYYDNEAFKYITIDFPEYSKQRSRQLAYIPSQIPINYSKMIVNKLSSFQFEKPIDIMVSGNSDSENERLQETLQEIHDDNNNNLKLLQAAIEANISGGVGIKLIYDQDDKQVKFMVRPRIETWVVTDPDDVDKVRKVHFVFFLDIKENLVWKQTWELVTMNDGSKKVLIEEAIWKLGDKIILVEEIIPEQFIEIGGKFLDFLPVYIIPNLLQANHVWGMSEITDLIPIIDELLKKTSDSGDALRFEMFAITVLLNMSPNRQNKDGQSGLKTKPGAMWSLSGVSVTGDMKSDVMKLESKFSYKDTLNLHMSNLKSLLFELSNVVQLDDKTLNLANISGVALRLLFAGMISKTNNKNTIWEPKLDRIYLDMLKLKGLHENFTVSEETKVEIKINTPIPENRKEELEIITAKLAQGLISTERAMKQIGIKDPAEELAKIMAENAETNKIVGDIFNNRE